MSEQLPPICDYEGSDYQTVFWEQGGRAYEDACEAIALRRLLPSEGNFMLELGAGAGRNTSRYSGYQRIALVDYSRSQLERARTLLGDSDRLLYVAADVYRLPFVDGLFDGTTMIRTLHHLGDPLLALRQVHRVMAPQGEFVLEFANKRNLKAMSRYLIRKQSWNPYTLDPIEFVKLNYNFHPKAVRSYLKESGFQVEKQLTVSHFRIRLFKKVLPLKFLVTLDSLLQQTGKWLQVSPSVFTRAKVMDKKPRARGDVIFQCPQCQTPLSGKDQTLTCGGCGTAWLYEDGIYDFRLK